MNHTLNNTNVTDLISEPNPWKESGAMVYVALTVATFSALTICCVWFFKQRWLEQSNYTSVDEREDVELVGHKDSEDSEEEIPLDEDSYRDNDTPDSSSFTLEDEDDSEDDDDSEDADNGGKEQLVAV